MKNIKKKNQIKDSIIIILTARRRWQRKCVYTHRPQIYIYYTAYIIKYIGTLSAAVLYPSRFAQKGLKSAVEVSGDAIIFRAI